MLLIFILSAGFAYFLWKFIVEARKYPPGPTPFPLIGNIPHLALGLIKYKRIQYLYQAWQAKYGPVFTMWMGPIPQVFIGDYDLAVESMVKKGNLFIDRKTFYLFDLLRWGRGIANANGQSWLEQRRFAIHTLKDFGLGKNIMEERVMLELDYRMGLLDKEIDANNGQLSWNPRPFIDLTEKESEFFKVKHEMDKMMKDLSLLDVFVQDWNRSWPFLRARYNRMMGLLQPVFEFLTKQVEEKKRQMESRDDVAEDFVETYLLRMKTGNVSESFDEQNLICTLFDLWLAGQETTALTLNWAFIYFTLHPEVTEQLHKELVAVTGNQRKIQLNDRLKTPYLNAEVLRLSSIVPVNLPRIAAEDVMVGGHLVPKGTVCTMLMSLIMADEKNYSNPKEFNPDRFLNGESDQFVVPFGLGKRACLREALAKAELYLIIGNMILFYDMKAVEGDLPKMEAVQEDEMKCRICSGETTGFLYKISSCRACAAFFRRAVQMKHFYSCEKEKECPIDHKHRCCRYCRMKKCLSVGMIMEGSDLLADYYLKGLPPDVATTSSSPDFELDYDELNPADCFKNHEEFEKSIKEKIIKVLKNGYQAPEHPFKLNLCQQSARAFEIFNSKYMDVQKKEADFYSVEQTEKFLATMFLFFVRVAEFFMEIEPFARLPFRDKVIISRHKGQSFGDITVAVNTIKILGRNLDDTRCVHFGGQVFDYVNSKFDMSTMCNGHEAKVKGIMDNSMMDYDKVFYRPFKIINPDNFEVQYILMKVVWNLEDIEGLSSETLLLADRIQKQLNEELTYYYNYEKGLQTVASRIYKIHNLMTAVEKVAALREDDKQMWKMFDIFKFDLWLDDLAV